MRAFADEYALSFPILHDPSGTMRQLYRVSRVPESFIVAKDAARHPMAPRRVSQYSSE